MAAVNPVVRSAGGLERNLHPGDTVLLARSITAITTAGNGTWTAAAMASGYIRRTGPTAAYADTLDTADNILRLLRGNASGPASLIGLSLEFTVANTVAFVNTVTAARGIVLGTVGGALNIAASQSKDFLLTIQNDSLEVTVPIVAGTGNTTVTFALAPGQNAFPIGNAPGALNLTPGMLMTTGGGSGIVAGATIVAIRQGQGGIIGVTCSNNVPAGTTAVIFSPKMELNNIGLD